VNFIGSSSRGCLKWGGVHCFDYHGGPVFVNSSTPPRTVPSQGAVRSINYVLIPPQALYQHKGSVRSLNYVLIPPGTLPSQGAGGNAVYWEPASDRGVVKAGEENLRVYDD
jgi:hypothetical protein